MKRKIFSAILAVSIAVGMSTASYSYTNKVPFKDISGHWAEELLVQKYNEGLITGYLDGEYRPDDKIEKSELVTIINRCFGLAKSDKNEYADISGDEWYISESAKAKYYGYVKGKEFEGNKKITKLDAINMIGNLLDLETNEKSGKFNKLSYLDDEDKKMLNRFSEMGFLKGIGKKDMYVNDLLSRAETMSIVDGVLGYIVKTQDDVETIPEDSKVSIIGKNITIKDKKINDLYVSPGVSTQVKIENVQINNTMTIACDTTVEIVKSNVDKIDIKTKNKDCKLNVLNNSNIGEINVGTNADLTVGNDSNINVLVLKSEKTNIDLKKVKVGRIKILGEASIQTEKETKIGDVRIESDTEIKGEGAIKYTYIKKGDVKLETPPTNYRVKTGLKADINGKQVDDSNDKPKSREDETSEVGVIPTTLNVVGPENISIGDTGNLIVAIGPVGVTNTDVTFSSSDESIATVSDGTVTALKEGVVQITVTSVANSSLKYVFEIHVWPRIS